MVEAVELSEGDRAALERAKEGASPGAIAVAVEILAKRALGATRLSPPAPEVDEATRIVREMRAKGAETLKNWKSAADYRAGRYVVTPWMDAEISYLRTALSELIASKDAEIERLTQHAYNVMKTLEISNGKIMELQPELAALRAENERLKATLNTLGTRWALRKAAERNTAEQVYVDRADDIAKRMGAEFVEPSTEVRPGKPGCSYPTGEYGRVHTDGSRSGGQPVDTAPVVEVTQADRDAAAALYRDEIGIEDEWFSRGLEAGAHDQCAWVQAFIRHRTEAEARGRREALEEAPSVCDGKEQEAFEAWARSANLDMQTHPLHWLFLDPTTSTARSAWKAAIQYGRERLMTEPKP